MAAILNIAAMLVAMLKNNVAYNHLEIGLVVYAKNCIKIRHRLREISEHTHTHTRTHAHTHAQDKKVSPG